MISGKGWGWWDYKAVGCPGKQRRSHVKTLFTHVLNRKWLLPIPVPVSDQSLDLAQFAICKALQFYFGQFLGSQQIHLWFIFIRDIHLYATWQIYFTAQQI